MFSCGGFVILFRIDSVVWNWGCYIFELDNSGEIPYLFISAEITITECRTILTKRGNK